MLTLVGSVEKYVPAVLVLCSFAELFSPHRVAPIRRVSLSFCDYFEYSLTLFSYANCLRRRNILALNICGKWWFDPPLEPSNAKR